MRAKSRCNGVERATLGAGMLLLGSCASPSQPTFLAFGGMREVMREGKTEPRVALAEFARPGWYGVGAMAGLDGEVLIDNGVPWVARGAAKQPGVAERGAMATLLTTARVDAWREVSLAVAVDSAGLESAIAAQIAGSNGADFAPVPFVLEGRATRLDLHVVRGFCPHSGPPRPEAEPDRWSVPTGHSQSARLIGFFAPGREGVLTHHGTALHLHALVGPDGTAMGHVDSFQLPAGATLRLPVDRH